MTATQHETGTRAKGPIRMEPRRASVDDLPALNQEFERAGAEAIVQWAADEFGDDLAVASSFGADSAVMLHLATRVAPEMKVITVDTGFLFPETIKFRDELAERLGLNLHVYRPVVSSDLFVEEHGRMWRSNPDSCCSFNKREPFVRGKRELGVRCWLTGIRRDQSELRRDTAIAQTDELGLIKLCPIATWTTDDVDNYLRKNDLPYHPLRAEGYLSIGCQPEPGFCTTKVEPGQDPRAGRWGCFDKTECGLHTFQEGAGI